MLASNFKTPTELGLTDAEHSAAIKLLGMLERGELPHVRPGAWGPGAWGESKSDGFNMMIYRLDSECGTVGCIAGWISRIAGMSPDYANWFAAKTEAINRLCHIQSMYSSASLVRPAQAALALRSFLTTGEANWKEALR